MPKETILVVEDEKDVQELLRYNLGKEGYHVLTAETGEKGLEEARSRRPDLLILDLMLPGLNGLEVCRLLKQDSTTRPIPVMMLTARNSETDQVVGLELGASDYLTKPFSVKVLLARVKNLLKSRLTASQEMTCLQVGDFMLDHERVRFSLQGKPITLTRTEFGILGVLMGRPSVVFSRERLVTAVWGEGALVSSSAFNMHIKSLRAKLGRHRRSIETVRGAGYRFAGT